MLPELIDLLIIGSGPAGYTAAIYAARANLKPVMITGLALGGQLMDTTGVEYFPAYPAGVPGPRLMEDLKTQAERFGTEIRFGIVTKVDFSVNPFRILADDETEVLARAVILATGAGVKWLGLESEKKYNGRGVSACATCDGFFYKNKKVAVVGGGDTALEEALYLSNLCEKVTLVVRKNYLRASKIMQDKVSAKSNIDILYNTEVHEILGDANMNRLLLFNNHSGEKNEIPVDGLFVAIGHTPNSFVFKDFIDLDSEGYVITHNGSKTNVGGIFACGDIQDKTYRQAVTAAGTGCMAALDAERYLSLSNMDVKVDDPLMALDQKPD